MDQRRGGAVTDEIEEFDCQPESQEFAIRRKLESIEFEIESLEANLTIIRQTLSHRSDYQQIESEVVNTLEQSKALFKVTLNSLSELTSRTRPGYGIKEAPQPSPDQELREWNRRGAIRKAILCAYIAIDVFLAIGWFAATDENNNGGEQFGIPFGILLVGSVPLVIALSSWVSKAAPSHIRTSSNIWYPTGSTTQPPDYSFNRNSLNEMYGSRGLGEGQSTVQSSEAGGIHRYPNPPDNSWRADYTQRLAEQAEAAEQLTAWTDEAMRRRQVFVASPMHVPSNVYPKCPVCMSNDVARQASGMRVWFQCRRCGHTFS